MYTGFSNEYIQYAVCLRERVSDLPHIKTAASSTFKGVYGNDSSSIQLICQESPEATRINTKGRKERRHKNKKNLNTADQKLKKYSQAAIYQRMKCKTEIKDCQIVKLGIISAWFSPPGDC